MFIKSYHSIALLATFALSIRFTTAHGLGDHRRAVNDAQTAAAASLARLVQGHDAYEAEIRNSSHMQSLATDGERPPFAFIGCSDSRVSEDTIFNAPPGTIFAERNVANQYSSSDLSSHAFLAYGVQKLQVQHIAIVGHYGCDAIADVITQSQASATESSFLGNITLGDIVNNVGQNVLQDGLQYIVESLFKSKRPEVKTLRASVDQGTVTSLPYDDPGFKALVEENTKHSADNVYNDPIIQTLYGQIGQSASQSLSASGSRTKRDTNPTVVFIHSWVYDMKTGQVIDLKHSYGPPGYTIPMLADLTNQV